MRKKDTIFYISTITFFGILFLVVMHFGHKLEPGKIISNTTISNQTVSSTSSVWSEIIHHLHSPFSILLMQILTIIISARILSSLMIKIGQPTVIGEIIAGIVLGPSLLGQYFPTYFEFIFPVSSFSNLQLVSQFGLILFMFIIGMELDISILKKQARESLIVSHASIIFPYFLGVLLSYFIYTNYAPNNIPFLAFALFMGIAMSITAFPVLARIVHERGMTKSPLGMLSLTCAAANDISAWFILAIVIALVKAGGIVTALITIILSILFVLIMFFVAKPILYKLSERYFTRETLSKRIIAIIFALLLISSFTTEVIGIHALFGAFVAGVIIPSNNRFRHLLATKIEDISMVLLLPLFFVYTGLRTEIGLINSVEQWLVTALIIFIAILGKFAGSAIASRFVGQSWKNSLLLGALMNTRGLMELVVLNIGYDLGVLSPAIFAMMVIVALVTTIMTSPTIELIEFLYKRKEKNNQIINTIPVFDILISFGAPEAGKTILRLVNQLFCRENIRININAIHFTPSADISVHEAETFEKEGFQPILEQANLCNIELKTFYKATNDVSREIVHYANNRHFDILFVGSSRGIFFSDETGGKVGSFTEDIKCGVGILIDKGFTKIETILFIIDDANDIFLLDYAVKIQDDTKNSIAILDNNKTLTNNFLDTEILNKEGHKKMYRIENEQLDTPFFISYNLVVVSLHTWRNYRINKTKWLRSLPTTLVINK